jgi:hypothetical protein
MIKIPLKNNQYFIHVTNILYKLLYALTYSRLTLVQKSQLSWIVIWFLFVVFFKLENQKEKLKSQAFFYIC